MEPQRQPKQTNANKSQQFLEFGHEFNRAVDGLPLPSSLQHIRFFHNFDQDLDRVCWPLSLKHVWLCGNFAQSVNDVLWPPALKVGLVCWLRMCWTWEWLVLLWVACDYCRCFVNPYCEAEFLSGCVARGDGWFCVGRV